MESKNRSHYKHLARQVLDAKQLTYTLYASCPFRPSRCSGDVVEPKLIPVSGKINDACWDGELVEDRGRSTQDRFPRNKLHQSSCSRSAADTDRINKKLRACANFLQVCKSHQSMVECMRAQSERA